MSDQLKYIILADEAGKEYPVIFPREIAHIDVAHGIMGQARRSGWTKVTGWLNPVAAGFFYPASGVTNGGSESLKMKSRPDDAHVIRTALQRKE